MDWPSFVVEELLLQLQSQIGDRLDLLGELRELDGAGYFDVFGHSLQEVVVVGAESLQQCCRVLWELARMELDLEQHEERPQQSFGLAPREAEDEAQLPRRPLLRGVQDLRASGASHTVRLPRATSPLS